MPIGFGGQTGNVRGVMAGAQAMNLSRQPGPLGGNDTGRPARRGAGGTGRSRLPAGDGATFCQRYGRLAGRDGCAAVGGSQTSPLRCIG